MRQHVYIGGFHTHHVADRTHTGSTSLVEVADRLIKDASDPVQSGPRIGGHRHGRHLNVEELRNLCTLILQKTAHRGGM